MVGWPIVLFLIAERLRNLGKHNFADVVDYRLKGGPIRVMAALSTLVVVIFYLIGQMAGAGQSLHTLLPQIQYWQSIIIVGPFARQDGVDRFRPTVVLCHSNPIGRDWRVSAEVPRRRLLGELQASPMPEIPRQ